MTSDDYDLISPYRGHTKNIAIAQIDEISVDFLLDTLTYQRKNKLVLPRTMDFYGETFIYESGELKKTNRAFTIYFSPVFINLNTFTMNWLEYFSNGDKNHDFLNNSTRLNESIMCFINSELFKKNHGKCVTISSKFVYFDGLKILNDIW